MKSSNRKAISIALSFVFILAFLPGPFYLGAGIVYMQTRNTIAVVQMGSDHAISVTIDEMNLSRFNHPIIIIEAKSPETLELIAENSIYLITIYVGHGSPEGIAIGEKVVSWCNLKSWIVESENSFHIVTACYGIAVMSSETQNAIGLPGKIDARVAGFLVQLFVAKLLGDTDIVLSLISWFFNSLLMIRLLFNPQLLLDYGPWSPWLLDPFVSGAITTIIYTLIAFAITYIALQILVVIGWTLVGGALLGFELAVHSIVEICSHFLCEVQWWVRWRTDPINRIHHEQGRFRVKNLLTHQYLYDSPAFDYWRSGY